MAEAGSGARKAIRDLADRSTELLEAYFEDALRVMKMTWVTCRHCGRKSQVPTPDRAAISRTIELMLSEEYGKPKSEGETGGVTLVVERVWPPRDTALDQLSDEEKAALEIVNAVVERQNDKARGAAE
jgi:hypothetical protein